MPDTHTKGGAPKFRRGKGCKKCGQSGYFGRVAIYEQFVINDRIKTLISQGETLHKIKEEAGKDGFQTLFQSALNKVRDGMTTLDEAFSVCATQAEMME